MATAKNQVVINKAVILYSIGYGKERKKDVKMKV